MKKYSFLLLSVYATCVNGVFRDSDVALMQGIIGDISNERREDLLERLQNIKNDPRIKLGPLGYEKKYLELRESFIQTPFNLQDDKFKRISNLSAILTSLAGKQYANQLEQLFDFLLVSNASLGADSYSRFDGGGVQHRVVEKSRPLLLESLILYGPQMLKKQKLSSLADFLSKPNKNGDTPLHLAVKIPDQAVAPKMVTLLVAYGASVDAKDKEGLTPLALAQKLGNSELVKLLQPGAIEIQKVNPDAPLVEQKISAQDIFKAIDARDLAMVQKVLAIGRQVLEVVNAKNETPLIAAAKKLSVVSRKQDEKERLLKISKEIFDLILEKTVSYKPSLINHEDKDGKSAIVQAALALDLPVIKRLVELGATVDDTVLEKLKVGVARSPEQFKPILNYFKKLLGLEKIVEQEVLEEKMPEQELIEQEVIELEHDEFTKQAINLIQAIRIGKPDDIKLLIENIKTEAAEKKLSLPDYGLFWSMALFYLTERVYQSDQERASFVPFLKLLFDLGYAWLYKSSNFSNTNLLHQAAGQGYADMVKEIIDLFSSDPDLLKAHLDDQDDEGDTPLHVAVTVCLENPKADCQAIYQMLIDAGADSTIANKKGKTAGEHYQQLKKYELDVAGFIFLQKHLFEVAAACDIDQVEKALVAVSNAAQKIGTQLGDYPRISSTLLFQLASCTGLQDKKLQKVVKLITNLFKLPGIELIRDDNQKTMLHHAVATGQPKLVDAIIKGAQKHGRLLQDLLNAQDKDGNTVMHEIAYCIEEEDEPCKQIERMLIKAGAPTGVRNRINMLPADIKPIMEKIDNVAEDLLEQLRAGKPDLALFAQQLAQIKSDGQKIGYDLSLLGITWSKLLFWLSYYYYETAEQKQVLALMKTLFDFGGIQVIAFHVDGGTMLHYAVDSGNAQMVELIINEAAKQPGLLESLLAARNTNGNTPLNRAELCIGIDQSACQAMKKILLNAEKKEEGSASQPIKEQIESSKLTLPEALEQVAAHMRALAIELKKI